MKALKGLWLLNKSKEETSLQDGSPPRIRSASSSPKMRPSRAGTNPDVFVEPHRARSGSTGSFTSGAILTDSEPFPHPSLKVAPPSFYDDSLAIPGDGASHTHASREKGDRERERERERDKDKHRERKDGHRDRDRERSKGKGHDRKKDGKPDDEYEKLLDSDKGDFDPADDPGRHVVYADSLADLEEGVMSKLRKSQIPYEQFEEHFDTLLRVLSFVSKSNRNYRRKNCPEPQRRHKPNSIFVAPGKAFKYPDQLDLAKDQFCKQEDPKLSVKFGEFEGRGGFGRVFSGKIKNPHSSSEKVKAAVKVMPHKTDKEIRMNLNEVGLLSFFNHPNIVKYLRCYSFNDELWLLMEFLEGGTLREATHNFQFAETHIAYVAKEMLKGIAYLHQLKMAHRDLKSANVMLSMKAEVKLIDFGLCADFSEKKEAVHMCGSPFWMPPEMINQQPHSLSTDIWSLAVCLIEMINRKVPHHRSVFKAMFVAGSGGFRFSKEEYKWSPEFHDLISKCLQFDPRLRPSASELLTHPFLSKAASVRQMQAIMPAIFLSNTMTRQGLL